MSENTTMQARAFGADGKAKGTVALPEVLFDGTVNVPVIHQVVKATLANQRQGTASTKTRGKVVGGNQKPWKQKGTGRARQGSTRAPHWPGGGTVFGPTPRDYTQRVQKKVRTLGKKSALNVRARENDLLIVDAFEMKAPSTKAMLSLLTKLGVVDRKVLFLTDGVKSMTFLSARNIPSTHVMPYQDVGTYHVMWSDVVIIEASALSAAEAK
jgi:large subunit ribosomal protein L4